MKYKLKVYSIQEFGMRVDANGNPHQEDSMYPAFGKATDADRTFVLCDGMGGHDAGEVASATVCETMGAYIAGDGHDAQGEFTLKDLSGAIGAAYDALDKKDTGAAKKMGTTMTFLKLHNGGATMAHMGDSRVYHIRPGKTDKETQILFETSDHSLVNELVKVGEMTHEEARHSRQKNVITRAMQPGLNPRPSAEVHETSDIKAGDYFYMCSDGMLELDDMEDGSVLRRIFSGLVDSDERRVEILRGATDENSDNHTAFIVHILDVEGAPAEMAPVTEKLPYIDIPKEDDGENITAAPVKRNAPTSSSEDSSELHIDRPAAPGPIRANASYRQPAPSRQNAAMRAQDEIDEEAEEMESHRKSGIGNYLLWGLLVVALVIVGVYVFQFAGDKARDNEPKEEIRTSTGSKPARRSVETNRVEEHHYTGPRDSRQAPKDSKKESTTTKKEGKTGKDGNGKPEVDKDKIEKDVKGATTKEPKEDPKIKDPKNIFNDKEKPIESDQSQGSKPPKEI